MAETKSQSKNWQRMKFKDFADTSPSVKLERGKEYPFIPMDILDGQSKFPLEVGRKTFSGGGSKFANGDTIFARITPCLENGKIAKVKDLEEKVGFGSTEFFVFRGKDGVSDSDFVYYLSRTDTIRDPAVKSMVGASGRQRADKAVVDNVQIIAPTLSQQKEIADVLSTYDDLIENNTRRIKILEEIAQAIYREWFVYFRFPRLRRGFGGQVGHEKVKMIDSKTEFGKIPEGWKIGKVKDVVDLLSGYAFKSGTFVESGKYKIITIKSVQDGQFKSEGSDTINVASQKMPEHCYLKDGDILLSLTGNIGRACLVYGEDLLLNQRVAKLNYKKSNRPFVYGLFRNPDFQMQLQNLAIGAAQQNLSPVQTAELQIIIPDKNILDLYGEVANSLLEEIVKLNKQNNVLRQARDLLLPKLVTGEIRV